MDVQEAGESGQRTHPDDDDDDVSTRVADDSDDDDDDDDDDNTTVNGDSARRQTGEYPPMPEETFESRKVEEVSV